MGDDAFNALRLSHDELRAILDRLDQAARNRASHSQRRTRRWSLQLDRTVISIRAGANQLNHLIVVPRNLSVEGIAVLHGGYLHAGTPCFVTLRDAKGKTRSIESKIVRCQHIERHLHEIGIHFDEAIDPQQFNVVCEGGDVFNIDHVRPKDLEGTILIVGERAFQSQMTTMFQESELVLLYAVDPSDAQGLLDECPSLVYLADPGLGADASSSVRELASSSTAPVLVLATNYTDVERKRLLEAGAREVIRWPCPGETVWRSAAEYLLLGDMLQMAEVLEQSDEREIDEREKAIDSVVALGERITQAMMEDRADDAAALAENLVAQASKLGDPVLARRARTAAEAVAQRERVAHDELGLLVRTCRELKDNPASDQSRGAAA